MQKKLLLFLVAMLPFFMMRGQVKPPKDAPQITFKVNPNEELLVEFQTDEEDTHVWVETEAGYAAPAIVHAGETKSVLVPTRGDFVRLVGKVSMFQANLQNDALVSVDVSGNSYLRKMAVLGSGLQSVNVDNCTNLQMLFVDNNFLLDLDVSKCPNLIELSAKDCQLESVKLGALSKLRSVNLVNNHLKELDVTKCPQLHSLLLIKNNLSTLNVSQNKELDKLELQENQMTALDVSANEKLSELWLLDNKLTQLDLKNNAMLIILTVAENYLSHLDLSNQYLLKTLICSDQHVAMDELDLSACDELEKLWATDNHSKRLVVGNKSQLLTMDVSNNELENVDLSNCPALVEVFMAGNHLKSVDVNGLANLRKLRLSNNRFTTLDLKGLTQITRLELADNQLTQLVLENTEMLSYLDLKNNQLDVKALNDIMEGLSERRAQGGNKQLFVQGNPGAERYNSQIPINKFWKVDVEGRPANAQDVVKEFEPYFATAGKYFSLTAEGKEILSPEYEALKKNVTDEGIVALRDKIEKYIKWPKTGYYKLKNVNPDYPIQEHYIGVSYKRRLQGLSEDNVNKAAAVFYCRIDNQGYIHFSIQGQSVEECYKKKGKVMWLRDNAAPYKMTVVEPGKVQFTCIDNEGEYRALNLGYVAEKDDYPLVGGTPEGAKSWWEMEDAENVQLEMQKIGNHAYKCYFVDFPVKPKTKGLTAYRVVWENVADRSSLKIIPIEGVIPASTPILLIANDAENTTVELEVNPEGELAVIPDNGNYLQGYYWGGYEASPWNLYVQECPDGVGFVQKGYIKYESNTAFLPVGRNTSNFEYVPIHQDEIVTGIPQVVTNMPNTIIYMLSGKRVEVPKAGIYIINGRKVIVN